MDCFGVHEDHFIILGVQQTKKVKKHWPRVLFLINDLPVGGTPFLSIRADLHKSLMQLRIRTRRRSRGTSSKRASCAKGIKTSGSEMANVFGIPSNSCVSRVEPHLPLLERRTRVPGGSPTSSASWMKASSGIRTSRTQLLN